MKYILIAMTLFMSLNIFAKNLDEVTSTFHSRLEERSPLVYKNTTIKLLEVIPQEIEMISAGTFVDLVNFAISLDLFSKGFDYTLNDKFYEVTNEEGTPVAYTYSITITKNGETSSIGMYELHRRVDGVFYQSREAAWY